MGSTRRELRKLVLADSEENECHDLHGDKNRIRPEQESEDTDGHRHSPASAAPGDPPAIELSDPDHERGECEKCNSGR